MRLHSLWITPSSELKKSLDKIIEGLALKYKSPKFEAHMTLLGDVNLEKEVVIQKTRELSNSIKPFTLQLSEISFSTTYFQSVFIRVKATASVMEANLKAKKIFKIDNNVFMPHISLLYGNHSMNLREKVAAEIRLPKDKSFKVKNIIVVPSTQNPAEWEHLVEIPV